MRISFSSIIARTLAVACLAALPFVSQLSHAAGLGRLTVLSALGQPLNAEVEIISLQPGEEDTLSARLAPMDAFRQAGIEFNPALLNVRFAIEQRGGKPLLRITSAQAVNEPFLDLLVELQWSAGRLVREYTFLLDPPAFRTPPSVAAPTVPAAPVPAPSAAPAAPSAPVKPSAAAPSGPIKTEPLATPRPGAAPPRSASTYQVKRGDTLAAIARENAVQGASFNQMLVALFRANSDAFIAGNVNRLREGRILSMPEREAAVAIDPEEARRFLQSQASDFAQYRRSLAGAVAAAPGESAGGQRSAAGAITAPAPAPSGAAPKDELKLSKADPKQPSSAASKAARGDDAASSDRAVREAQSRVSDLEKTVADLQKLLELKNKQMAELEAKSAKPGAPAAGAVPAPAKPAAVPTPAAPAPAAAPPVAAKAEAPPPSKPAHEAAKAAVPEAGKAPAAPEAAKAAAPAPSAPGDTATPPPTAKAPAPAGPKPAAKAKPAPPAPPPPPPSMVDEFLDNPMALGGLGLVVLLLVGYGAWAWRKKKKAAQATFQDSSLGVPAIAGAAAGAAAAGAAAPAFAEPTLAAAAPAPAAIGTEPEEVDPVAEADVYMAYGRDAQAEEILKEALQKDPNRLPVLGKLVEIYAHRKDGAALAQTALKLKNLTGGSGPDWEKAAGLGKSIDPQNGLYSGAEGVAELPAAAAPSPALDFDLDASAAAQPEAGAEPASPDATVDFDLGLPAPGAAEAEKTADTTGGLDFDLGASEPKEEPKAEAAPEAAPAADAGLDFDLGMGDDAKNEGEKAPETAAAGTVGEPDLGLSIDFEPGNKPAADAPKEKAAAPEGDSVDFDLDLDLGASATPSDAAAKPAEAPPLDLSSISLDLDLPAEPAADAAQDIATKLDLAKAYEEMGDKSGARDLLNEVIKGGDPAQQSQAKEMLVRLG